MTSPCAVGGAECPGHAHDSLVCSGQPLGQALGTLVVAQINLLRTQEEGCCERCCASCHVLADLLDTGRLRLVAAEAPTPIASLMDDVTDEWLRSRWSCRNNPPCESEGES